MSDMIESLRKDLQDQGLLPKPLPAYDDPEFHRVVGLLQQRLLKFPVSSQFVKSLADGTTESHEILSLIVSYVGMNLEREPADPRVL